MNRTTDLRRTLGRLRRRVTGAEREALHTQVAELSGEVSTLAAQLQRAGEDPVRRVDVAIVSDFRLRGGTTASIAEEVRAQSAAGLTTALIHAQSAVTTTVTGFSRHIQSVMGLPGVHIVSPRAELDVGVVVIRHPTVIGTSAAKFGKISTDRMVIVANHPAIDADETWHYSVRGVGDKAFEKFGVQAEWAPISPVVRASILAQKAPDVNLTDQDWANIFGHEVVTTPRTGFVTERPVIGRHSRPDKEKWPATARDIRAAYPESTHYQVEVLGGAAVPEEILGEVPGTWHVQPFGSEAPDEFLQRIDFWVYMHHPGWKEAFGRAIMEALAAGCLVVLPHYLEEIFGAAAVYAEPGEVTGLIDQYWMDRDAFLEQSRRGQQFAVDHGPGRHLERLRSLGVTP
ncbi:glycosyltransferase [Nesterenkonia haasae]|uniref:glycosyltransferase n=1 Tax=Nesterenkonia haasae TaxID=2587813 RepID=UPI0013918DE6|nr:hypothetical protein [Nesterenkonia haasae]NDK30739.1 hypothetical protein [Nesterenkonia haasae]